MLKPRSGTANTSVTSNYRDKSHVETAATHDFTVGIWPFVRMKHTTDGFFWITAIWFLTHLPPKKTCSRIHTHAQALIWLDENNNGINKLGQGWWTWELQPWRIVIGNWWMESAETEEEEAPSPPQLHQITIYFEWRIPVVMKGRLLAHISNHRRWEDW